MRPRIFLSLALATLSLAAVACTALLGDFTEGRPDAIDSGLADAVNTMPDATPEDATADAAPETPFFSYTCTPDNEADPIGTYSEEMFGAGTIRLHVVPSLDPSKPDVRIVRSNLTSVNGYFATRVFTQPILDAGVPDLGGRTLAIERFPGGIVALTHGTAGGTANARDGIFLSKLYDGKTDWEPPLLIAEAVSELCVHYTGAISVVDAKTDEYVLVWARSVGTMLDDGGGCDSQGQRPRSVLARRTRADGDGGLSGTTKSWGGERPRDYIDFGTSAIAPFDGGVAAEFGEGDRLRVALAGADMALISESAAIQPAGGAVYPYGISGDRGASTIRVAVFSSVSETEKQTAAIRVARTPGQGFAPLERTTLPASVPIAEESTVLGGLGHSHSDDFALGYAPNNFLLVGNVPGSNFTKLNVYWFDADGRLRARNAGTRDGGTAIAPPGGGVYGNADIALIPNRTGSGDATNSGNLLLAYTLVESDGGVPTYSLWTRRIVCVSNGAPQ